MNQKYRDIILGILTAAGTFYLIMTVYTPLFAIVNYLSDYNSQIFIYSSYIITSIIGLIFWRTIKLSKTFSKSYLISFIIILIFEIIITPQLVKFF